MKMKWLSRTLAVMLTGVMTAGMLSGCGGQKDTNTASTSQVQEESASQTGTSEQTESQKEDIDVSQGWTYPVDTDVELSLYISYQ